MPSQTIQQQPHQAQSAPIMQMVCRKGQEKGQEEGQEKGQKKVQTPIQCCYEQNWWAGTLHQQGGATPVVVAMVMGVDAAVVVAVVVVMVVVVMVVVRVVGAALK